MTRTERTYYVVFGLYNAAQFFIGPIYPLFLLSRGLDLFEINAVLATYLITAFLLDVPTGAFADRFGRKRSVITGCVVRMGAYALYVTARNFRDCLVAEFIDAVGTVLVSGALDAWAVDGVRAEGDRRPTDRLFARGQVLSRTALIVGGVVAGYLGQLSLVIPWLVAATAFGVTAAVGAVTMREPRPGPADGTQRSLGRAALDGLRAVRRAPVLLLLCLLTLAGAFAGFPLHLLWQPRIESLSGQGPWLLGWVMALLNLSALAGSALLPRILRRYARDLVLAGATLWRAALLAIAAAATTLSPAVAGLVLQEMGSGLIDPITAAWTNEHIAAEHRATVLSARSTFFTFGGATGLLTIGLVARAFGIPVAWAASAAIFALTTGGYVVLGRIAGRTAAETADVVEVAVTKATS